MDGVLTPEQTVQIVESNRERIRALVNSLLSAAGIVSSAGGLLLFFLVERDEAMPVHVVWILSAALLMVVGALFASTIALMPARRKTFLTMAQFLDLSITRYRFERVVALVAGTLLLFSLVLFVLAFAVFLLEPQNAAS